jgi:protein-tyrosine-phosphatase
MQRVLFICTANICRSPMAEAIFNALAEDRGLDLRAQSAGVGALIDEPITPNASAALEEVGIHVEGHRARQVSEKILREADLVLAMSPWHVAELRRVFGNSFEAYTLPNYVDAVSGEEGIADPYGSTITGLCAPAL